MYGAILCVEQQENGLHIRGKIVKNTGIVFGSQFKGYADQMMRDMKFEIIYNIKFS